MVELLLRQLYQHSAGYKIITIPKIKEEAGGSMRNRSDMSKKEIVYQWASGKEYKSRIQIFLEGIDEQMIPRLSERVKIDEYALKLAVNADNLFAVIEGQDVASCSIYCDREIAFISSIAVIKQYQHMYIGSALLQEVNLHANYRKCERIQLKVHSKNAKAYSFYEKNAFYCIENSDDWISMECKVWTGR